MLIHFNYTIGLTELPLRLINTRFHFLKKSIVQIPHLVNSHQQADQLRAICNAQQIF